MRLIEFLKSKLFIKHLFIAIILFFIIIWFIFLILRIYTDHGDTFPVPDFRGMTLKEVKELAETKKLRIQVIDSVYSNNYKKGTVVDQNPPQHFNVKKRRNIFLTINATNPEKVKMPNLVGISLRYAKAILENNGLQVGRLRFIPDLAINNVLFQQFNKEDIKEGTLLVKNSKIDLVLGKGFGNANTIVPDLKGLSLDEAKNSIVLASLNSGTKNFDSTIENKKDSMSARVWHQYPEFTGIRSINLGATVDIWLTVDSSKYIESDTTSVITTDQNEAIE